MSHDSVLAREASFATAPENWSVSSKEVPEFDLLVNPGLRLLGFRDLLIAAKS
jgi:hypothetical protein